MLWFVITAIAAIGIAGALVFSAAPEARRYALTGAVVTALVWLGITFLSTVTTVEAGHVGLVRTFGNFTGRMDPGVNFKAPWQSVIEADVRLQSHQVHMDGQEGSGSAVSAETQPVLAVVTINYNVRPDCVVDLYRDVGSNYYESVIEPRVQQVFKARTVEYSTVEVAPNREEIRRQVQATLDAQLDDYCIDVADLLISNLDFAPAFVKAIEDKQVATQNALAAQERVKQATAEAAQKVEAAKGEAQSIAIRGRALRENPEILQLEAINKLNPNVQTIYLPSGGSGFILNLPTAGGR